MVRIVLIFHPETQANLGDLQGSETAIPLGHQSFPAWAQLISQHPTAFYLNLPLKLRLGNHRTHFHGDHPHAGWLLAGLSPGGRCVPPVKPQEIPPRPAGKTPASQGPASPEHPKMQQGCRTNQPSLSVNPAFPKPPGNEKAPPPLGRGSALPTPPPNKQKSS